MLSHKRNFRASIVVTIAAVKVEGA